MGSPTIELDQSIVQAGAESTFDSGPSTESVRHYRRDQQGGGQGKWPRSRPRTGS